MEKEMCVRRLLHWFAASKSTRRVKVRPVVARPARAIGMTVKRRLPIRCREHRLT